MSTRTKLELLATKVDVYYYCQQIDMWVFWFSANDVASAMLTVAQLNGVI